MFLSEFCYPVALIPLWLQLLRLGTWQEPKLQSNGELNSIPFVLAWRSVILCSSLLSFLKITEIYRNLTYILAQGSPDLKAAKEVASYLGTVHHEFHFSVQVTEFSCIPSS